MNQLLLELLRDARRILIVGGPKTGKTTLAFALRNADGGAHSGRSLIHTDDIQGEWSEVSAKAAELIGAPAPWLIEGVATARALRKWLAQNPEAELDATIVLTGEPFVEVTKGQAAMNKGVSTVWNEIAPEVLRRGARVINAASPESIRRARESQAAPAAE